MLSTNRSVMLLAKYYSGDQIKNSEMGGAWGTFGRQERCVQGFGGETWDKEATWQV
jgi:hypothetical protein